jgi:hypothetical protein
MIFVYIVLALLVVSVAWIFAMIAQLAAGLPEVAQAWAARQGGLDRLTELEADRPAPSWPPGTQPMLDYLIVVLSTTCTACTRIAGELADNSRITKSRSSIRLVVVAPETDRAVEFATTNQLQAFAPLIDENGKWCREELGISQSPTLFVVRGGVLTEGFSFNRTDDIEQALDILSEPVPSNGQVVLEKGHSHA